MKKISLYSLIMLFVLVNSCLAKNKNTAINENENLFMFSKNNKWGYINKSGEIIIQPKYDKAELFFEGKAAVMIDKRWGYINTSGKLIIKNIYEEAYQFEKGIAKVLYLEQYRFINKFGKIIYSNTTCDDEYNYFSEGVLNVCKNNKVGFIDTLGREVVKAEFDYASPFTEGLSLISKEGKYGFIDKKGNVVIKPVYSKASSFSNEMAQVKINNKWGYIDKKGNVIINPLFDTSFYFNEDKALVGMKTPYGFRYQFVDKLGKIVSGDSFFDYAQSFNNGLAIVKKDNKWGYIDSTGSLLISYKYDRVNSFYNNVAAVQNNGKWGFINKQGEVIIDFKYETVSNFSYGFALVKFNGKWGAVNALGNTLLPPTYDDINMVPFVDGLAYVFVGGNSRDFWNSESNNILMGYINNLGKAVWVPSR